MTIWHPHTEHPAEDLTTAIIAVPPGPNDDPDQGAMLLGVIHVWKNGQWFSESGEIPLDATVFWWCAEDYLLDDLPDAAHERVPAKAATTGPITDRTYFFFAQRRRGGIRQARPILRRTGRPAQGMGQKLAAHRGRLDGPSQRNRGRSAGMNIFRTLAARLIARTASRPPDFIIGGALHPYLRRWWLIPRNRWFNIYLHHFCRSDDDRALHDHPWANCSVLLAGEYTEHTIDAGGIHRRQILRAGSVRLRLTGKIAHRIELHKGACWTLFITGPRYREWGFHCPEQGWVHWQEFTAPQDAGAIGRGCGE